MQQCQPESQKFIRPQRRFADIVVRFAPIASRDDPPGTPLSLELFLRPTIQHPALSSLLTEDHRTAMHLKIMRDQDGTPTDCLHVHGHASSEEARQLEKVIWEELNIVGGPPKHIGEINGGERSDPLALTQLILLYHLLQTKDRDGH